MRKLYLFFITYFCFLGLAFAQPVNDDPANAIDLTVNATCTTISSTNVNATDSGVGAPGCAGYSGGDVWFKFTVPATGKFTVDTDKNGGFTDSGMAIYSGSLGALVLEDCDDDGSPNGLMSLITESDLTNAPSPGDVLYVRVWEFGNNNFGTFLICAFDPPPAPNDEPINAINLTVGRTCSNTVASNRDVTASEVADPSIPAPGCAGYSGGDVWFTFTVPASGEVTIETSTNGGFTDGGMALYSGNIGSFALIECDDDDGPGLMPSITRAGLNPGDVLYARVWEYGNDSFGNFNICVFEPNPGAPTNDEPATAINLAVGASCSSITGDNVAATDSEVADPSIPAPGCASYQGGDVWYKFTVPASGDVTVTTTVNGAMTDSDLALYSGNIGSFNLEVCTDGGGVGAAFMAGVSINTLTPGDEIYVRVWEYGNNTFGAFAICVVDNNPPPPPANNDLAGATALGVSTNCVNTGATNISATSSEVADPTIPAPGCGDYQGGDVWFTAVVPASGDLSFTLSATGGITDASVAIYTGSPGSLALAGCMNGSGGMPTLTNNSLAAGSTVYIRAWENGNDVFGGFNICVVDNFVAPPPPPPPPPAGGGGGGGTNNPAAPPVVAPTNLTGIAISWSQINLTWEDNSDNEDGFRVYKDGILIATLTANTTTFSDSLLNANTFFNYKVQAFSATKHASSNTLSIATLPLAPNLLDVIGACGQSVAYIQMGNAPNGGVYRFYDSNSDSAQVVGEIAAGYFTTPVLTQTTTFYATVVIDGRESTPRVAVEATVDEAVVAELTGGSTSIISCDAQTNLEAVAQTGATYQWKANGVTLSETSNMLTATLAGNYQLIVSRGACTETLNFKVSLNYQPVANIQQGSAATFCDAGTLSAGNVISGATYEWLLNGNTVSNSASTTVSESGTYTLKVTENTCVNTASISVSVISIPDNQAITASATQFCKGETVTLSVPQMAGISYRWFFNGSRISGTQNSIQASGSGDYQAEMFANGLNCSKRSASVSLSYFDTPAVELTRDDKTLSLTIPIPHQSVEWFTTGGESLPQFANQTSISPDFATYWAVITYPSGCTVNSNSIRFFEENPTPPTGGGGPITGLEGDEDEGNIFDVFPNPSNDGIFHVRLGNTLAKDAQLKLTDALGRDLNINISIPQGSETLSLNLSEFAEGIYYLQFISKEGILTKKIIKQ